MSLTRTLAARDPAAPGENVTLTVQLAPAASVEELGGQLSLSVKSPALVPLIAMLLIDSAAVPEFVSVTDWGALVLPTAWDPNDKLDGDNDTAGAVEGVVKRFRMFAVIRCPTALATLWLQSLHQPSL